MHETLYTEKRHPKPHRGGGTKELEKRLTAVEQSRGSETAYGLVSLSDSPAVTDSAGKALPTSENNAGLPGTMANRIAAVQDGIRRVYSKTWLQNSGESEDGDGFHWIVGKTYTSAESFDHFSAFSMDLFWEGSQILLPYYNNETDNLIAGSVASFTGEDYLRIKAVKIRYTRGSCAYAIASAGIVDVNASGEWSFKEFRPGETIDGFRFYGIRGLQ